MKFLVYGFLLPYGRAIMGGLMFSTIVTLFILPSIYVGLDNLNLWGRRGVRRAMGKAAKRFFFKSANAKISRGFLRRSGFFLLGTLFAH